MDKSTYVCDISDASVYQREDGTYFAQIGREKLTALISISQGAAPSIFMQMKILANNGRLAYHRLGGNNIEIYEGYQSAEEQKDWGVPRDHQPPQNDRRRYLRELLRMAAETGDSLKINVTEAPMDEQMRPVGKSFVGISRSNAQMEFARMQKESEERLALHQKFTEEQMGEYDAKMKLEIEKNERQLAAECEILKQNSEKMKAALALNIRSSKAEIDNYLTIIDASNEKAKVDAKCVLEETRVVEEAYVEKLRIKMDSSIAKMKEENRSKEALRGAEIARLLEEKEQEYKSQKTEEDRKHEYQLTERELEANRTMMGDNLSSEKHILQMKYQTDLEIAKLKDKQSEFETELAESIFERKRQCEQILFQEKHEYESRVAELTKAREMDSLRSQARIKEVERKCEADLQAAKNAQDLLKKKYQKANEPCILL